MEMVMRRRRIIEENVARDRENVRFLSDSLSRAREITENIVSVKGREREGEGEGGGCVCGCICNVYVFVL